MRLYPQFIIWTYIVLPAICLFLAPAFISLFVKAQHQKVKILANALNAKARTAAALAKHQAKMQHFRNSQFSNAIGKRDGGFKMRSKRDVEGMVPVKRTHRDQQEESMGQLQNMWNMNMNNMMNDGILREADPHKKKKSKHGKKFRSSQQIDDRQEFEVLGSPRIYDDKKIYGDGPESYTGSFFGRNVYDDVLARANTEPMENEFARSHKKKFKKFNKKGQDYTYYSGNYYRNSEAPIIIDNRQESEALGSPRSFFGRNVYDDALTGANEPMENESARSHKKKFKKFKKKGQDYTYYSGNYYRNAEAPRIMENAPHEDMMLHEPNLMSVHVVPMQDLHFEPHDDHMDFRLREEAPNSEIFHHPNLMGFNFELPHDRPPTAFRRINENEEMMTHNMPQEFILKEPNLMPQDLQQEARSSSDSQKLRKNPDVLRSLPDSYDTGYGESYGSSYGSYDSSYGKPSKKDKKDKKEKKFDLFGKKLDKLGKDKDKTPDYGYGGYGNDYDYDYGSKEKFKFDPMKLYEKAVQQLTDLKKKLADDTENLLLPDKDYKIPKIYPQTPVANYVNDYSGYDDGYSNGGYINNPSNGGYIGGADLYKEAKSANPDPTHSHTITHSHSFTHHTDLLKNHPLKKLYLKPHDYSDKAEAHSKTLHFKHGGYSQADSKSISYGTKPNLYEETQGYGHSISQAAAAQAAAQANSGNNYNNGGFNQAAAQAQTYSGAQFNNGGFSQAQSAAQTNSGNHYNNGGFGVAQSTAQTNSGNHYNNGGFGVAQSAAQTNSGNHYNNGGFGVAQSAAQTQGYNGHSSAQSAAKVNSGGFGEANAQANSNNNGASAQAASQTFSNAAFGHPHVGVPAGSQFIQVLAPSNFVNARSNDDNQPTPNGKFVMPHLQEISVSDTLHGILDESNRFTRSHGFGDGLNLASSIGEDIVDSGVKTGRSDESFKNKRHSMDNIFGGLNLASGIVHASLNNPLAHQHNRPNNDKENTQEAMNLASGIVDSSLKVGKDAGSLHGQRDSLESAEGMFSSISDIVHQSVRHKRQISEGNNNYPCPAMTENKNDAIVRPAPEENIPKQDTTDTEPIVGLKSKMDPDHVDFKKKDPRQQNQENNQKWDNEPTNFDDEMIEMINPDDPEFTTTYAPFVEVDKKEWGREEDPPNPQLVDDLKVIVHPKKGDEGFYEELENQQKNENVTEASISSSIENGLGVAPTEGSGIKQDESTNTEPIIDTVLGFIEPNKNISTMTSEEIEDIQFRIPAVTTEGEHSMETNQQDSELLGSPHNVSESASTDPLASIEKEMSILTEEEQEAFIKQEMALIADFIEETLHREPLHHTEKNKVPEIEKPEEEHHKVAEEEHHKLPEGEHHKLPEEEHHEVTEIKEPEAVTKMNADSLSHQSPEKNQQPDVVPLPPPLVNSQDSELIQEPIINPERLSSPHLFQTFERDIGHEPYERHTRAASSLDQTFDEIVGAQREKLHKIHSEANQDANLLLIRFIGEGIINDLENSKREVEEKARSSNGKRLKRKIAHLNPNYYPIKQLVKDPRTKIDIPKTLENVGTVVRYTFEDPRAPMYHVRSLLGNTKNTVMAAAKVPPNNILLPTQYEVTRLSEDVGAINPTMVNSRSGFDDIDADPFGIMNTFQQIGGMVQGSVNSGKDVVRHANDVASDVKQVYYTTKNSAPLVMLPSQIPVITSRFAGPTPESQAIFVAPRVLHLVGTAQEPPPRQFVGMGNILDAVGVSNPNQPDFETERIMWKPNERKRQHFLNPEEEKMQKPALKQFFNKMHQEMKEILTAQHEERKRKLKDPVSLNLKKDYEFSKKKPTRSPSSINYDRIIDEHKHVTLPPEILGIFSQNNSVLNQNDQVGLNLQPQLMKPFMGQPSEGQFSESMSDNGDEAALERINNDKLERQSYPVVTQNPVTIKSRLQDLNENDRVGLNLQPDLMKPFMGQPSEDEFSEFNNMRENGDEVPLERKNENESRRRSQPVSNQNPVKISSRLQDENDRVGLNLRPELMKPFMGQPSKDEYSEFMRENGDEVSLEKTSEDRRESQPAWNQNPVTIESRFQDFDKNTEDEFDEFMRENEGENSEQRKLLVYPIFPLNFNITIPADGELKPINLKDFLPVEPIDEENMMIGQKNPQYTNNEEATNSTGRISMTINEQFQKPFLGLLKHDKVHSLMENGEHYDEYPQENYHPVKNVVYSDNDDYIMW